MFSPLDREINIIFNVHGLNMKKKDNGHIKTKVLFILAGNNTDTFTLKCPEQDNKFIAHSLTVPSQCQKTTDPRDMKAAEMEGLCVCL